MLHSRVLKRLTSHFHSAIMSKFAHQSIVNLNHPLFPKLLGVSQTFSNAVRVVVGNCVEKTIIRGSVYFTRVNLEEISRLIFRQNLLDVILNSRSNISVPIVVCGRTPASILDKIVPQTLKIWLRPLVIVGENALWISIDLSTNDLSLVLFWCW